MPQPDHPACKAGSTPLADSKNYNVFLQALSHRMRNTDFHQSGKSWQSWDNMAEMCTLSTVNK